MISRYIAAFALAFGCCSFATPASAQSFGIGQQISAMAQDGVLGRDLTNLIREYQLQRLQQGPPHGKAWGLRGGKPYTGNGHPLNGLPNGRVFRSFPNDSDAFRGFGRRSVRQRGRGFGRGRGRR